MAETANCIICGSSNIKNKSGHVHFDTRIVIASWCEVCSKLTNEEIRSKRNVAPVCEHMCYGRWKSQDGLKGCFRRAWTGKSYPATDDLK